MFIAVSMMLVVRDIHKSYKKEKVLEGISFEAATGTVLGICGNNGAGKSTLINILASVLPPDRGQISLRGISIEQSADYRSMIGFVPQFIALSERLSVYHNLEYWALVRGLRGNAMMQAVESVAVQCNLSGFMSKKLGQCSGGMARRVNLAAGLIGSPYLLLLDEPTAGMDEESRELFLQLMHSLSQQQHIILMVNHYADELAAVSERILVLNQGQFLDLPSESSWSSNVLN